MSRASSATMRHAVTAWLLAAALLLPGAALGQQSDHQHPDAKALAANTEVGVDEHLGRHLPLDTPFTDEYGHQTTLGQVLAKAPTILVPIYMTCPSVCNVLQSTMADVVNKMDLVPGRDYQVVFVSFDEHDTPALALTKKKNYMAAVGGDFPPEAWRYLLGDHMAIMHVVDQGLGFHFKREGDAFVHPVILVAVGTDGLIARYLYGERFLPFDLTMAVTEAGQGKVGLSVKRVLSYCFSYDPESKAYVFDFMRVTGAVVLLLVVGLFVALVMAGRKKKKSFKR